MALAPEVISEATEFMTRHIAAGFMTREHIVEWTVENLMDGTDRVIDGHALGPVFDQLAAAHRESSRSWPDLTDCDRLDAAFDDLNSRGVMARHNWSCCQNCGHSEMEQEYDQVLSSDPGMVIRGFCFYHQQDTERVVETGNLWLAYDSTTDTAADQLAIGREVVDTLARHGLGCDWDGTADQRIAVRLTWQRRSRPARWCGE